MATDKVTFREDSEKLEFASELWEDGPFENKTEFYRFVGDFTLEQFFEDYEPHGDRHEEIIEELEEYEGAAEVIADAQTEVSTALEYAGRMQTILQSGMDDGAKVEEALRETNRFVQHYFPESYAAERADR